MNHVLVSAGSLLAAEITKHLKVNSLDVKVRNEKPSKDTVLDDVMRSTRHRRITQHDERDQVPTVFVNVVVEDGFKMQFRRTEASLWTTNFSTERNQWFHPKTLSKVAAAIEKAVAVAEDSAAPGDGL